MWQVTLNIVINVVNTGVHVGCSHWLLRRHLLYLLRLRLAIEELLLGLAESCGALLIVRVLVLDCVLPRRGCRHRHVMLLLGGHHGRVDSRGSVLLASHCG